MAKVNALFMDEVEKLATQLADLGVSEDEVADLMEPERGTILENLRNRLEQAKRDNGQFGVGA